MKQSCNKGKDLPYSKIIVISISVALISAFGFVYSGTFAKNSGNNSGHYEPMWIGYPYLGKLAEESKDIVVGKVIAFKGTHYSEDSGIPLTDFNVVVEKSIKGDIKHGDDITVEQVASLQLGRATSDEDTPMNVGERYVLFLSHAPREQIYYSLGGPQGRYLLDNNDRAYSMDAVHKGKYNFVQVKANGKSLNDFTSEILDAIKNPDATKPVLEQDKPTRVEKQDNSSTTESKVQNSEVRFQ